MAGIQAVILASGFSRRLGVDKLSRVLCGKTVLQRVVENALGTGMGRIVVVIRERGQAAIVPKDKRISIIFNENADAGMSSSIKAAILKADPEFDSFLFMNGDMPFFSTGSINKLVELWKGNPEKMACIRHAGVLRGPVIFPRKYTDLLLSLEGESGGRDEVEEYLVLLGKKLDFRVTVIDHAPMLSEKPDELISNLDFDMKSYKFTNDDFVVILTKGERDIEALEAVSKGSPAYVGLMASRKRAAHDFEVLKGKGISQKFLDSVNTPIGVDIGAITPFEIAISIASQITKMRRERVSKGIPKTDKVTA